MPSDEIQTIDLDKEVLLRIGDPESEHSVPWDTLKSVGNSLEALVLALAKHSKEVTDTTNLGDFKLDFTGFYSGSAIPAFKLNAHPEPSLFRTTENNLRAKRAVAEDFSKIMKEVDKANYKAITDYYSQAEAKNEIIKRVYDFTNSAGAIPVSIVKREGPNEFSQVYKVKKLKKGVLNRLLVNEGVTPEPVPEETTAVAKMIITTTKSGKVSQKPSVIYDDKEATLSLKLDHIDYLGKRFLFNSPLDFSIFIKREPTKKYPG